MPKREQKPYSIPQAIILGACIVVFVPMANDALRSWRAAKAMEQITAGMKADIRREREANIRRKQAENHKRAVAREQRTAALRLRPDQRCVSGTVVIQRTEQGRAVYVQLLENLVPVPCKGRNRLKPRQRGVPVRGE